MPWLMLVIAGVLEIGWAIGLKYTHGFTRLWPSLATAAALVVSVALLAVSVRTLPTGTAYAVWVGIGALGTSVAGMLLFNEPATVARVACLMLILAGVVGLKMS